MITLVDAGPLYALINRREHFHRLRSFFLELMKQNHQDIEPRTAWPTADLRAITRQIVEHFQPRRVVLFGSHARRDAGPESDIDLFIEMETDRRPPERAASVAALFGLRPWSLDVVVYTPEEVDQLRGRRGTLLACIEQEGQMLYERT